MTVREKLFSNLSREKVANFIEKTAFGSLTLSILALALKGIAVTFGFVGILSVGPFLTASIGLFITFMALIVLSVALDYETVIEAMLVDGEPVEDDGGPREVNVQQARNETR